VFCYFILEAFDAFKQNGKTVIHDDSSSMCVSLPIIIKSGSFSFALLPLISKAFFSHLQQNKGQLRNNNNP